MDSDIVKWNGVIQIVIFLMAVLFCCVLRLVSFVVAFDAFVCDSSPTCNNFTLDQNALSPKP